MKSIAGTTQFDTADDCGKVVPNDYTGKVSYWYTGPFEADPEISHRQDEAFWEAFKVAYPNIETDVQSITYNELLDKFRTALLGNAGPDGRPPADPRRRRVRRQGLPAAAEARRRRLLDAPTSGRAR